MCESPRVDRLIVPLHHALEVVNRASHIHLRACPCRAQNQPNLHEDLEVCLLFDAAPAEDLQTAREITKETALTIIQSMAQQGVVYNLFYLHESQVITEICNCCGCCCRPLKRMMELEDYERYERSSYLAVLDTERCTGCRICETSCLFGARECIEGTLLLHQDRCFGCGRCLAACPEQAISLEQQADRGVPIPIDAL